MPQVPVVAAVSYHRTAQDDPDDGEADDDHEMQPAEARENGSAGADEEDGEDGEDAEDAVLKAMAEKKLERARAKAKKNNKIAGTICIILPVLAVISIGVATAVLEISWDDSIGDYGGYDAEDGTPDTVVEMLKLLITALSVVIGVLIVVLRQTYLKLGHPQVKWSCYESMKDPMTWVQICFACAHIPPYLGVTSVTVLVYARVFLLLKVCRFQSNVTQMREMMSEDGGGVAQGTALAVKTVVRLNPAMSIIGLFLGTVPLLSYSIWVLERWQMGEDDFGSFRDTWWYVIQAMVAGEMFDMSIFTQPVGITAAFVGILATSMLVTAILQSLELDANQNAAAEAVMKKKLIASLQDKAALRIGVWWRLYRGNLKHLSPKEKQKKVSQANYEMTEARKQLQELLKESEKNADLAGLLNNLNEEITDELGSLQDVGKDIRKKVVDQGMVQAQHTRTLASQDQVLEEQSQVLAQQSDILAQHTTILAEQTRTLNIHGEKLDKLQRSVETVQAELRALYKDHSGLVSHITKGKTNEDLHITHSGLDKANSQINNVKDLHVDLQNQVEEVKKQLGSQAEAIHGDQIALEQKIQVAVQNQQKETNRMIKSLEKKLEALAGGPAQPAAKPQWR